MGKMTTCTGAVTALLMAATLATTAAFAAVTVTNRDEKEHKITIIEGAKKQDYTLKALEVLENVCEKGCILRLNGNEDDDYQLEPNDLVSIEDGALYYDNPDEDDAPKPSDPPKK